MTAGALGLLVTVTAVFLLTDGIGRGAVVLALTGATARPREEVFARAGARLLGSHVWLIVIAGLLYGLFPRWEVAVISHAYWWVLALAVGLAVRVAAVDFRRKGARPLWESAAGAGALATGAGTGGLLAVAAGVWPVLGAAAVLALDVLLARCWLGDTRGPWAKWAAAIGVIVVAGALAARYPDVVVHGAGTLPAAEVASGPVTTGLILTGAIPTVVVVLAVQAWWWRTLTRSSAPGYY